MAERDVRFSVPLYTQAEAAQYLGMPPTTLKYWANPTDRIGRAGQVLHSEPLVTRILASIQGMPSVPFIGLAEAVLLASLRRANVPMKEIRPAIQRVKELIGVGYALAHKKLYLLGGQLLWDAAEEVDLDPSVRRDLIVLKDGQYVFRAVVDQYLKCIEYGRDGYAARLHLPGYEVANVIADPHINFGRPYFASTGAPVSAVLSRLHAGEPVRDLAEDFELSEDEIAEVAQRQPSSA